MKGSCFGAVGLGFARPKGQSIYFRVMLGLRKPRPTETGANTTKRYSLRRSTNYSSHRAVVQRHLLLSVARSRACSHKKAGGSGTHDDDEDDVVVASSG
jgi:hypothetical protein